jgi:hypothetical protein
VQEGLPCEVGFQPNMVTISAPGEPELVHGYAVTPGLFAGFEFFNRESDLLLPAHFDPGRTTYRGRSLRVMGRLKSGEDARLKILAN